MAQEPPQLIRRVVTGVDEKGRSVVVSDGETPTWVRRPTGSLVMDVWGTDALPPSVDDESTQTADVALPPPGGLCVRIAVFPPDRDVDEAAVAAYEASLKEIYGEQGDAHDAVPGMHRTDTVDVVTVVDGEIWVVMEEGETLLRTGDCLVQRGTRHAWRNRSDRPCTLATTMIAAVR